MKPCTWVLLIGLAATHSPGCKKPPAAGGGAASPLLVKWPTRPADGAPVALVFAGMTHRGEQLDAELRVFSFSQRAVRALRLTFHFLDKKGGRLGRLAYPRQGQPLVGPKTFVTLHITARMPSQTDRVTVTLNTVVFRDGSRWIRPEKRALPNPR